LGFTLAEVLVTIVIVGILAAIAIPRYRKTIERGYWREAQDLLMTIYHGERAFFFTNTAYCDADNPTGAPCTGWRSIHMDNPNLGSIPVTFSVTASGSSFTATATRADGSGRTMTIDQNRNVDTSAWPQP